MSSIVLVKQEIGDRVSEAAEVAGYSERNFRRYLAEKMKQALPLICYRYLYNAGYISKATFRKEKRERIVEIINMKNCNEEKRKDPLCRADR